MVAMNAQTYSRDLAEVSPGGWLIYDSTWPRHKQLDRDDVTVLGVPLSKMCNESFDGARARILMKNIAYVGVVSALLDIDLDIITSLLEDTFADKKKLIKSNMQAIRLGYDYARENFVCPLPKKVAAMNGTEGHIVIDGNTAAGLGCMYAGATVGAWYPITPSTSLMDAFRSFCSKYRVDPETGGRTYCIIQAEDELAAIGMVLGASWNGARSFTSRPVNWHADQDTTGRHHELRLCIARRHETCAVVSGRPLRVFWHGPVRVRLCRTPANTGHRHVGSRHRHERLDGAGV
jgi:2-oxoglutarate ferredoxin oxidoreductase subunit alpha